MSVETIKQPLRFAVIGSPLSHSISPLLHEKLFKKVGIDAEYTAIEIPRGGLAESLPELRALNGFNVTIPHKTDIISLLDEVDSSVRCGAVNTVLSRDGRLVGYNTDTMGIGMSLSLAGIPISGSVLICGSGGAARAAAFVAAEYGCSVTIATRESGKQNAEEIVSFLKTEFSDCECEAVSYDRVQGVFGVMINATPCGMFPDYADYPFDDSLIKSCASVLDLVYNPRDTLLLKKAAKAGIPCLGGIMPLAIQAVYSQGIWLDKHPTMSEIAELVAEI